MNKNDNNFTIPSTQRIFLFGVPNLQNSILVGHIQQQAGVRCRFEKRLAWQNEWGKTSDSLLILIDAELNNHPRLNKLLDELHSSTADIRIAFFGVSKLHPTEKLIAWPLVQGIFYYDVSQQLFLRGIDKIFAGELWLPRQLVSAYLQHTRKKPKFLSPDTASLTKREYQILQLAATGASNQEIAQELNVSSHTIKTHFYNLFKKTRSSNRMQAVIWARENLLLHDEVMF